MAAQPQVGFSLIAREARPARRAGPIVRLPQFRPWWADEGGLSTGALNHPDGLLRSVAERLTSANRPRPAATAPSPPEGTIKGGVEGPRELPRCQESRWSGQERRSELHTAIARRGGSWGLNRPRRGQDPAPGRVRPMPAPGGNTTRPENARRARSFVFGRPTPASWDGQVGGWAACGRSTLTPGRAGWSR